jgi:hypothetical protein
MKKYARSALTLLVFAGPWRLLAQAVAPAPTADTTTTTTTTTSAVPTPEQVSPPIAPASTTAPSDSYVVHLSPFEVVGSSDNGFQATDTLAGSRIRSNLNDVGDAIQVATKEFMQDIGATDSLSLLQYMTSTEVGGVNGNFAGIGETAVLNDQNQRLNPSTTTRVRGLAAADNTRDFFLTDIAWDSYNTSRIDIQRGSNSILFGNGSPAGIINGTTDDAVIGLNQAQVSTREGSYGSNRESFSLNGSYDDELAVRVAGLNDHENYRENPAYDLDERKYVALKWNMKFLDKYGIHSSVRANYEEGNDDANRPHTTPPIDEITPWFITSPRQVVTPNGIVLGTINPMTSHAGYNPFVVDIANSTGLAAANPNEHDIGAHETGNANTDFWLWPGTGNGVNGTWYSGLAAIYPSQGTSQMSYYLNGGLNGISGVPTTLGLRAPDMVNIVNYGNYAIAANFLYQAEGIYRATTLSNPSIYNFYDQLIDGPNAAQWNHFHAVNAAWDVTGWNDHLGYEVSFDHQNYVAGQSSTLGGSPVLAMDIWNTLPIATTDASGNLDPVANPNFGRPFTIGTPSGSQYQHLRTTARFEPYVLLDSMQLSKSDDWWTKIVGVHSISGLLERSVYDQLGWNWLGDSLTDAESQQLFGTSSVAVNGTNRDINTLTYLGPSVAGRSSLAGANIPNITAVQNPTSGSAYYFNPTYLSTAPAGNAPWAAGTTTGLLPNQDGVTAANAIQSNNPANYAGWNATSPVLVWNANAGDRSDLYTQVSKQRQVTETAAAVDQWSLFDRSLIATIGMRKDEDRSYLAGGTGFLPTLSNGTVNWNAPFGYPGAPNNTYASGIEKTYDLVWHLPRRLMRYLPWGTQISVFYNQSDNFQPLARVDIFGKPLAPPTGQTRDRGFLVTTANGKLSLKMNWYVSEAHNASILNPGNSLLSFLGDEVGRGIEFSKDVQAHNPGDGNYAYTDPVSGFVSAFQPVGSQTYQQADAEAQADAAAVLNDVNTNPQTQAFMKAYQISQASWSLANPSGPDQYVVPAGADVTGDTISKGTELEITYRPTDNWNIAINGSRTFASQLNLTGDINQWVQGRFAYYEGPAGDLRWFGGSAGNATTSTGQARFGRNAFKWYSQYHALEGTNVPELRPYALNVVTNYEFGSGSLKGILFGGAWRWQDKNIIGYGVSQITPSLGPSNPAIGSFNTQEPYYGPIDQHVDLWTGYEHKFQHFKWRIQLNVYNTLDNISLVPITANPDGSVAAYRIQQGPSWQLTNTFTF